MWYNQIYHISMPYNKKIAIFGVNFQKNMYTIIFPGIVCKLNRRRICSPKFMRMRFSEYSINSFITKLEGFRIFVLRNKLLLQKLLYLVQPLRKSPWYITDIRGTVNGMTETSFWKFNLKFSEKKDKRKLPSKYLHIQVLSLE